MQNFAKNDRNLDWIFWSQHQVGFVKIIERVKVWPHVGESVQLFKARSGEQAVKQGQAFFRHFRLTGRLFFLLLLFLLGFLCLVFRFFCLANFFRINFLFRQKQVEFFQAQKVQYRRNLRDKEMRKFVIRSSAHAHQKRIKAFDDLPVQINPFRDGLFCQARKFVFVGVGVMQQIRVYFLNRSHYRRFPDIMNRNQKPVNRFYKGNQVSHNRSVLQGFKVDVSELRVFCGPFGNFPQKAEFHVCLVLNARLVCVGRKLNYGFYYSYKDIDMVKVRL